MITYIIPGPHIRAILIQKEIRPLDILCRDESQGSNALAGVAGEDLDPAHAEGHGFALDGHAHVVEDFDALEGTFADCRLGGDVGWERCWEGGGEGEGEEGGEGEEEWDLHRLWW